LENYPRALSSRDAEKYVDGEDEVVDFETIINEVALLRNKWLGIMKGLDSKQWMTGHIVRLRTAGMEDVQV
jgi:NOL1/NOP2/fmu family ribosome biogenesis protein